MRSAIRITFSNGGLRYSAITRLPPPQTDFEKKVQQLYLQGNSNLQNEEYNLALNAFRQLENLILTTVHPTLPIDSSYLNPAFRFPVDISLLDTFTL